MVKEESKRTLDDLIDEALAEKDDKDFTTLSIVVGFEKTTKFVQVRDERRAILIELAELVKAGGEPLGLLGTLRSEDKLSLTVYHRIFQEFVDDESIQRYFDDLMKSIQITARSQGSRVVPTRKPETN